MWISEFQLNNYKSYLNSGTLKLSPGINVIVGRNHAGKTALLEGLSLHFPVKVYRSSKIKRSSTSSYDESSWAVVSLSIVRGELFEILRGSREFSVPLPSKEELRTAEMRPENEHVLQFIDGVFSHDEFTFQVQFDPSTKGPGISHLRFPSWGCMTPVVLMTSDPLPTARLRMKARCSSTRLKMKLRIALILA